MALNFGENESDFTFNQSDNANQGIQKSKRIETASIVVAIDESGDFTDIEEAIKSLDDKGGFIQIKEGNFRTKSKISVPSNITIRGAGYNTRVIGVDGEEVFENEDLISGNENIEISDMRVRSTGITASATGIRLKNCESCLLKNIKFESTIGYATNYSILIEDSTKILINGCTSLDLNAGYGIQIDNCTFSNIIENNMFGESVSINIMDSDHLTVTNNQCNEAMDIGISLDDGCSLINVANNVVSDSGNYGIYCNGDYCIIHGNIADGAFTVGIRTQSSSSNCIVTENMATTSDTGTSNIITNNKNI